jgi:hypothetical protein
LYAQGFEPSSPEHEATNYTSPTVGNLCEKKCRRCARIEHPDAQAKLIIRSVVVPVAEILNPNSLVEDIMKSELDYGQLSGFFYAVNIGNQPTTIVSLDEYMHFGERLPMERPYESGKQRKVLNIRLEAGQSSKISFSPRPMKSEEVIQLIRAKAPFYVMGRIIYTDDLNNSRETAFCRKLDPTDRRLIPVGNPDYEYAD